VSPADLNQRFLAEKNVNELILGSHCSVANANVLLLLQETLQQTSKCIACSLISNGGQNEHSQKNTKNILDYY